MSQMLGSDVGMHQPPHGGFSKQLRDQRDFLSQFMRPDAASASSSSRESAPSAPREAAAGLPPSAAKVLITTQPPGTPMPWRGLPASHACLAATLRLFSRLVPNQGNEDLCGRFCQSMAELQQKSVPGHGTAEQLLELASDWSLQARMAVDAIDSLEAMVKSQMTACCLFLDSYVGVLEDPETGDESEQEVGNHCVLIVGGDLLGPNYVVFDPWGPTDGEVSLWPDHAAKTASPSAWVDLKPLQA
eukprot:TRINITY_DN7688_c4_g1_i1.p1 TRINITY_DN7688_c4_g1~~TRINITY_DN7688_c4_g1_i1.p1  ORF type:complete len:276 (-),score=56.55 TRINITY_DN7688_c4_g1_i1:103-837(-)